VLFCIYAYAIHISKVKFVVFRYEDPKNIIKKAKIDPIPAYECWTESQNVDQLDGIKEDSNGLHMESLTIRERILGSMNPDVPQPVVFRGAVFADHARFDRCIELWLHALNLRQKRDLCVTKDLLRFAQAGTFLRYVTTAA